jgi:hypothetical protein
MKLFVTVRDKETRQARILEMDYPSKKAFKRDIRANGLQLVHNMVYTEQEWEELQNGGDFAKKMEYRIEYKRTMAKIRREVKLRMLD